MPRRPASSRRPAPVIKSGHAERRAALTDELASFVLREGLRDVGLRELAKHQGTSDRMLLYYFETKEDLIRAVLDRISERLEALLPEVSRPSTSSRGFLSDALALVADARVAPFMKLWVEIVARAARGEEPYRKFADGNVSAWLRWVESRIGRPARGAKAGEAAAILAIIDGITLLEMAKPGSTRRARVLLSALLQPESPPSDIN